MIGEDVGFGLYALLVAKGQAASFNNIRLRVVFCVIMLRSLDAYFNSSREAEFSFLQEEITPLLISHQCIPWRGNCCNCSRPFWIALLCLHLSAFAQRNSLVAQS